MTSEKKPPFLVQAIYSFKGKNNDELCFKKNEIITVTQVEEGGWWEGTLNDKTGWFPSNYVKEYKPDVTSGATNPLSKSSTDLLAQQIANRTVIIKDLIDSEKAHVTELDNLVNKFLVPINCSGTLNWEEYNGLVSNITEVVNAHENLLKNLIECSSLPPEQQRIGRLFLTSAVKLKQIHEKYCLSHPKAVLILDKYKDELNKLMESNSAPSPGTLVLVAGLSKPFRRLDKYNGILQELKRYMEESHVDRGDVSRSISVYKDIATSCSSIRRQKELELQILNGGVRGWEGDDLSTLGQILRIGSVAIGPELKDRYLILFPTTLLILSVSNTMTAFVYEGKLPLTGIKVTKLEHTDDSYKNAFEIKGPMIEEIIAICQTKEDQQMWINDINKQISFAKQSSLAPSNSSSVIKMPPFMTGKSHSANVPKPPPHAVSSIPYIHLTMYFARLVRKKIITRKILKKLLYKEYINRYNTEHVPRRRVHRSEYIIYPEKASITWISSSSSSSVTENRCINERQISSNKSNDDERMSMTDDDEMTNGSKRCSSFHYISKPVFRTTLKVIGNNCDINYNAELKCSPNLVCEDLSKIDDNVEVYYELSNRQNFQHESRQSEPLHASNESNYDLHSVGFKSFSVGCDSFPVLEPPSIDDDLSNSVSDKSNVSDFNVSQYPKKYYSSYCIGSPVISSNEKLNKLNNTPFSNNDRNNCEKKKGVPASSLLQTLSSKENERCLSDCHRFNNTCKLSVRSSDSGLADITSSLINTSTRGQLNIESDSSSNFEGHCVCTSPFETTPHTSASEEKVYITEYKVETAAPDLEPATFKSGMYAHWWLKTKIPAHVLKTPVTTGFSSDTGKIPSINHHPQWSITRLRPSPPIHCNLWNNVKQSRNSSKGERSFAEDAQILQVIETYCTSNKMRYTVNSGETINVCRGTTR